MFEHVFNVVCNFDECEINISMYILTYIIYCASDQVLYSLI